MNTKTINQQRNLIFEDQLVSITTRESTTDG